MTSYKERSLWTSSFNPQQVSTQKEEKVRGKRKRGKKNLSKRCTGMSVWVFVFLLGSRCWVPSLSEAPSHLPPGPALWLSTLWGLTVRERRVASLCRGIDQHDGRLLPVVSVHSRLEKRENWGVVLFIEIS